MKISYMLAREDFYTINQQTLDCFFKGEKHQSFYIYPQLNAIVAKHPSKAVRRYLYTEFRVQGNPLRKAAVWGYARAALNSGGLLSATTCAVPAEVSADTLIYPCNKKIRIFDFSDNTVSVITKSGFPNGDLQHEIEFRTQNVAPFIPQLLSYDENGYTERIIDGFPLARAGKRISELTDRAVTLWKDYVAPFTENASAGEYTRRLTDAVNEKIAALQGKKPNADFEKASAWAQLLADGIPAAETVPVTLSHGDLQSGNIWVENQTDRIYIIDWESHAHRSAWYDDAVLFDDLRTDSGFERFAANRQMRQNVVLLEDLIYRLEELGNLPSDYGTKEFNRYVGLTKKGKENV